MALLENPWKLVGGIKLISMENVSNCREILGLFLSQSIKQKIPKITMKAKSNGILP